MSTTASAQEQGGEVAPAPFVSRSVGLHERFCLVRSNLGFAPIVCITGLFPLTSSAGSDGSKAGAEFTVDSLHNLLRLRVDALLDLVPQLGSRISDRLDYQATFIPTAKKTAAGDLIKLHPTRTRRDRDEGEQSVQQRLNRINVDARTAWQKDVDVETGPLWRIDILPFTPEDGAEADEVAVSVAVHHVMVDGKGLANLFETLLAAQPSALDQREEKEITKLSGGLTGGRLPPTSDGDLEMKPSLRFILPILVKRALSPYLPAFLARCFGMAPRWPSYSPSASAQTAIQKPPFEQLPQSKLLTFSSPSFLARLKEKGAAKGVGTVQGCVHAAASVALWWSITSKSGHWKEVGEQSVRIETETPFSARIPERGHGWCTGNFVGGMNYLSTLDPTTNFWNMARKYADLLLHPDSFNTALMGMGMLSYLPDGPPIGSSTAKGENSKPTDLDRLPRLEQHFNGTMRSPVAPYRSSLGVSNVGAIDASRLLPTLGVAWSQLPSPFVPAIMLDCIGLRYPPPSAPVEEEAKGTSQTEQEVLQELDGASRDPLPTLASRDEGRMELSISVGYRRGAVEEAVTDEFVSVLPRILHWLADGGSNEVKTIKDVVDAVLTSP